MIPETVRNGPRTGRHETKYVLPSEAVAAAIRDWIEPFTVADPHAAGLPGRRYSLASLYLDSAALDCYLDTVRGEKNRHKLRIRHYSRPDSPAFFEVKSKVNDVVLKRRAAVHPEAVAELVAGAVPRRRHLLSGATDELANLLWFRDFIEACAARPTVWVRYFREPRVGVDGNGVRITFDREVCCCPAAAGGNGHPPAGWHRAADLPVILEVKFDEQLPSWAVAMIRRFNLIRTSVPKYVLSVDACRRLGLLSTERGVRYFR